MEGLEPEEVKQYIRFIGNRRLTQLGLNPIYDIDKNPLPWMDEMLNGIEHMNFFEGRATEYTKAATDGTWDEAGLISGIISQKNEIQKDNDGIVVFH